MADGYVEMNGVHIGQLQPNQNGDYFEMRDLPLFCNPTIRLEEIRTRRFNSGTGGFSVPITYVSSEPRYVGIFPIRTDIMVREDGRVFSILDEIGRQEEIILNGLGVSKHYFGLSEVVGGFWVEPENQNRETCLFCDAELKKIIHKETTYCVCGECDKA